MTVRIEGAMESPHFTAPMGVALTVHPDEKAMQLFEVAVHAKGHRGWRRAQVIYVNRGDRLARWAQDLGPWDDSVQELSIPSMWVHSVARLQEMADKMRTDDYWQKFLDEEMNDGEDIIAKAIAQYYERRKIIRNQSVYGPGGHKQRDGFPTAVVRELAKARVEHARKHTA